MLTPTAQETVPLERLRAAVAREVITQAQLDALLADDAALAVNDTEAPHALNAVSAAYYVGAAAVVFALGWFLAERIDRDGPGVVLGIAVAYAALFGGGATWLLRRGFRTAAAMAALLAVCTAPLAAWAVLELAGWWPATAARRSTPLDDLYWIPVELALVAAALVTLRRVRFALLALPVSGGIWFALLHTRVLTREPALGSELDPYLGLVSGTGFVAAAYLLERWQVRTAMREDYAFWPYLVGVGTLVVSVVGLWEGHGDLMAGVTLVLALLAIAIAVRLERRVFLVAGAFGMVGVLAHLANEFRDTALFPLVLALIGGGVILATVWLQRRYPSLLRGREGRARRPLPGGPTGLVVALVVAIALSLWARTQADRWRVAREARWRERARVDSVGAQVVPPRPPPRPR